MHNLLKDCIEFHDTRSEVVVRQHGKTLTLDNVQRKAVQKVRVDGCFPQQQGEGRCDYLMVLPEDGIFFLIELKGGDLVHGLQQINDTFDLLASYSAEGEYRGSVVVSRNVPDIRNVPVYR